MTPTAQALLTIVAGDGAVGFTLAECIASDTADREGIDNRPPSTLIPTIAATAQTILMPIRRHYGVAFHPNSFFRSFALERVICASAIARVRDAAIDAGQSAEAAESAYLARKQHPTGHAIDIKVPGVTVRDLGMWYATSANPFDQLIFECYDPDRPGSGWCHISHVGPMDRREILWTRDCVHYNRGIPPR